MSYDVVVCGAGVGGLASARALGALGLSVLVLDRQAAPAEVAKGELLQPESVRILHDWGALPALLDGGAVPVSRLAIRDPHGRMLLGLDYDALPGAYRQILCTGYANVLRALAGTLDPKVEVRRGVLVEEALRDPTGRVTGVRVLDDGKPVEIPARLVVAADGLSSRLRKSVELPGERHDYDHKLLAFDLPGVEVADEVSAYRGEHGLRLVYPLPGGRCRLYVQIRADEMRGLGADDLAAWCDRVLAGLPALAPLAGALRANLRHRQILAVYRLRAPRLATAGLALVGEAAHAVHPMAAQGMNSSLGDAETLADLVGKAGGNDAGAVDRALTQYHRTRLRRLDHTATVSHNAARMLTSTTGVARLLGGRMMRHTAGNPRLLRLTTGNLAGVDLHRLTPVDRLYQLGLLSDRRAYAGTGQPSANGGTTP
ncbi:FAD-dependent oxidoreductase [Micromonospora sp. NBC_01796]|uniref:FAD-dependent oxidoreductase n=1 Tax=Micromonospora sp. NBC_01796 TaxID=2975987 RepID=UPI002DDC8586|nr:NAD(P)/FAD-dependent oxidoreductase [Micromonospora sp. NBC_01796]WSA85477.1 FAD-dependent monooxygenase [Micromonospora sp. NBC_01796]